MIPDNSVAMRSHSTLGLISFIVGTVPILIIILAVGIDSFLTGSSVTDTLINRVFYLLGLLVLPLLNISGTIFGIIGVRQKNTKSLFSIMGVIFNVVGLILIAAVWIFILLVIGLLAIVGPVPVR